MIYMKSGGFVVQVKIKLDYIIILSFDIHLRL